MKFSIRDLLWLMVVAALATGWFIDHLAVRRLATELAVERDRMKEVQAQERAARAQAEDLMSVAKKVMSEAESARQQAEVAERPMSPQ